jgi:hypothetical protein
LGNIPDRQEVLLQSILTTIKEESFLSLFPNSSFILPERGAGS